MLRKLRRKFIGIMMAFATVMLVTVFGLVIFFSQQGQQYEIEQMMQTLAENPFRMGTSDEDGSVHLPYFIVEIGRKGEVLTISSLFYDTDDEESLKQIAQAAAESEEQSGALEGYSLYFYKATRPTGIMIIFADTSSLQDSLTNLIQICAFIGVLALALFFGLSVFLSRWMVKPVEQAWEQQRQFVADASHELKTPLTVIMTDAELLQSGDQGEEAQQQFISSILTMSQQMRGLVEGLLELARVDNGAVKTSFETVNWSELVSDGVLPFEPLYFEKGLMLQTQVTEGIQIRGSQRHLQQVLEILLDNAMKYAAPESEVQVTLRRQGSHAILAVASRGEEIQPEDLKNIFKRFYRVDKARSRDGSYGLGLSIADSIVREHGGRIWAESAGGVNTFLVQIGTV